MPKRILIADDNEQNLYLSRFLLEQRGFDVLVARNGVQCISLAQTEIPDLILMDIQMPEMDGYEAIRQLRATPKVGTIPIVVVSSYAMANDRERALNLGCTGYIEKPIVPESFVRQVTEYLAQAPVEN
ncbi:MAG: response regulator [Gammaproteobacteria bacterium]